jgi:hypothetical protein
VTADCGSGELRVDSKHSIEASRPKRVTRRVKEKEEENREVEYACSHHGISLTLLSAVFKREYRGVHSSQKVQFDSTCRSVPMGRMVAPSSPVQRGLIIIMLAVVSRAVVPSFPAAVVSHAKHPCLPFSSLSVLRWSGRWEPRRCYPWPGCKLCWSCRS